MTLVEDEMGAGISLTVHGCVWELPCSLYSFHSACSFHQKQAGIVVVNVFMFLEMHHVACFYLPEKEAQYN